MKRIITYTSFIFGIISFILFLINVALSIFFPMIVINYTFWTPLPTGLYLFGFTGFFMYIWLMFLVEGKGNRILLSIVAFMGVTFIGFFTVFGTREVKVMQSDTQTVYILEERFLFGGEDTVYVKSNFIYARKIGLFPNNEDSWTSYRLVEDTLTINQNNENAITINLNTYD